MAMIGPLIRDDDSDEEGTDILVDTAEPIQQRLPPDNPSQEWCPCCSGEKTVSCEECGGSGHVTHECDRGYEHEEDCDVCDNGLVDCFECGGTGTVLSEDLKMDKDL